MPKKDKNTFSHFFKEDAENVEDIINPASGEQILNSIDLVAKEEFPRIVGSEIAPEDELKEQWNNLRSFFRNGNNTQGFPDELWPVTLAPLYTKDIVVADFPIWIADESSEDNSAYCLSLKEIILSSLNNITEGKPEQSIIGQNIDRILLIANEQLKGNSPQLFSSTINQIFDELENQLNVSGEDAKAFQIELSRLKNSLPQNGILLPYSSNTSFQLLEAAIVANLSSKRKNLIQEITELKSKLKDLLRVEREKGPERNNPDKLHDTLSFVDSMMKFDELSSLMPEAGSELMGTIRVQRVKNVMVELEKAGTNFEKNGYIFIDDFLYSNKSIDWENLFENAEVKNFQYSNGCSTILSAFEQHIESCLKFFVAKRIGELELDNRYRADIHDEYFEHFDWSNFSADEFNSCSPFLIVVDDNQLFDAAFSELSSILSNNIPIKVLAVKQDNFVNQNQNGSKKEEKGLHAPAELGALMLSFKNIYVTQSTSITPSYLFNGFKEGLAAFAPAFFHVLNIDQKNHANPFLWTSAMIEARDFPGFTFKGLLGTPWGSRFEVSNNPQPSLQWPVHKLKVIDQDGDKKEIEFPFTFADQAILSPAYHHYFLPVNSSFWSDNLIPLTEYMRNSSEENIGKVPFIWMMDEENELHKVAVSWPIVIATQERLDFWRFLQENSGINNYHVSQAVEEVKAEMKAVHSFELNQIIADKDLEIQKIREEEAEKVMENLTSVLLDLDTSNLSSSPISTSISKLAPTSQVQSAKETVKEAPEQIQEEEDMLSIDPYIDTPLCTACDECTGINGSMFKYNADKLAYIADSGAGTFKQLVEAAELCPVGIIHPGSPLNANEPDLDNLIKRAEKFN